METLTMSAPASLALAATPAPAATMTLCCPCCGEREAEVSLQLWDGDLKCNQCDEVFSQDDLRAIMAGWTALLGWLDLMPKS
jgi:hypothetical protein